ncbi:hypothetical protein PV04_09322 [Phialophora macrospora]|uniref:DASH complex subunit DAD4 n=1 Tax=Phialophora macrospora TaxID=1851006 RepID=A0A0D2FBZ6_9EURO|nr:hypothetical protein PV04_09322 [Phialophora macrospora]
MRLSSMQLKVMWNKRVLAHRSPTRNASAIKHFGRNRCVDIHEPYGIMESPHEQQQSLLLSRIITNIEKLNEAVVMMNRSLQEVNIQNMNVELVAQMFKNYQSNVLFHLEATENLKDPL